MCFISCADSAARLALSKILSGKKSPPLSPPWELVPGASREHLGFLWDGVGGGPGLLALSVPP